MAPPETLLAKKPLEVDKVRRAETLLGHTLAVTEAANHLAETLAPSIAAISTCGPQTISQWKNAVALTAWMHDWGKANDHFQHMLADPSFSQGIRHEAVSLIMVHELESWLTPVWKDLPEWVKCGVLFAVSGHHLKFPDPFADVRHGTRVTLFMGHDGFGTLLQEGASTFGLGPPPNLENKEYSLLTRGDLRRTLFALQRELDVNLTETEKLLIATVKATTMAADLAGSALPSKTDSISEWMNLRLDRTLGVEQIQQIAEGRLDGYKPILFQRQAQETSENTVLIEAGCGSGKTVAAYLWASHRAAGKRLFFCYPTTCTASEGFAGYLHDPEFDALLVHSRAQIDYRLLDNMPEPTHEETDLRQSRLEALETWPFPAVVCTAHTVLGLLENVRRGIYAWPSLARAAFVFDEIHAFSDRLFSYLLRFLHAFRGSPVLLMTATLPPSRRSALQRCCESRGGLKTIHGPVRREEAKRYILATVDVERAWQDARATLADGGKVLWVCNTVARAMKTMEEALRLSLPVEPFHSRYRYKDRLARQRKVIDGFEPDKPAMLAVTTQVAEMSLDLSADLLVTEHAPVPAMIQRLGRLNRFDEVPDEPKEALLIEPENRLPYEEELWQGVGEWITLVCDGTAKAQRELAEAFIAVTSTGTSEVAPALRCEWLDGLWTSLKDKRAIEEGGYAIEVIREEDVQVGSPAEYAIPIPFPKGDAWKDWQRVGRYLVAPQGTIVYDEMRGAKWSNR